MNQPKPSPGPEAAKETLEYADDFEAAVERIRAAAALLSRPEVKDAIAALRDATSAFIAIQDAVKAVAIQDAVKAVAIQDAVKAVAIQDAVKAVAIQDAVKAVAAQGAAQAAATREEIRTMLESEVQKAVAAIRNAARAVGK